MLSALIGSISFAGSLVAFAKLQELMSGRPITYPRPEVREPRPARACSSRSASRSSPGVEKQAVLVAIVLGALAFGVLFVLPIGGADMPVVISMLNAFTGLAASATGFVLHQTRADRQRHARRRLGNDADADDGEGDGPLGHERPLRRLRPAPGLGRRRSRRAGGSVRPTTAEDVAVMLAYAQRVVIVPGYGLAVAQAQHVGT